MLRTITFVILIILSGISCNISTAQSSKQHHNAVYLAVQPSDYGLGIRGDYYMKYLGLYSSLSHGNGGLYKKYDIKHHTKFTTGLLIPLMDSSLFKCDFTCGVNYHLLGSVMAPGSPLNPTIYKPWSFELGVAVKFKRIAIAVATDILRWEPCIYIGIPLLGDI
jgi:hypothetical protein